MRKLPARYRAGQGPQAQEEDEPLQKPAKAAAVAVTLPSAAVTRVAVAPAAPVIKVRLVMRGRCVVAVVANLFARQLGAEVGIVLKRRGAPVQAAAAPVAVSEADAEVEAARRRAAARAKAKAAQSSSSDSDNGDGDGEDRGALDKVLGQRVLPVARAEDEMKRPEKKKGDREDSDSDGGSDSDSDRSSSSSSSSAEAAPMMRPVFVSKNARSTVKDEAQLAAEEEEAARAKAAEEQERVAASKQLLGERVAEAKSAAAAALVQKKEFVPINVDDVDETQEYELWKVRELSRMKREREERRIWVEQKAEVERRRLMDDDEILAEDGDRGKGEKAKLKFLQRYYHKGAFYQDELKQQYGDEDFSAPTGADADIADKSLLPAVMQVRSKWALRGRTKYTHLTNEDTTFAGGQSDRARFGELPAELVQSIEKKRAGTGSVALPSDKKKYKKGD